MRALMCALAAVAAAAGQGVWLDVPFVRQSENGCGSASVAMIVSYWAARSPAAAPDTAVIAAAIQRELYSAEGKGIYAGAVESYLRRHGFRTFAIEGRWEDLEHHLARGRPLLIALAEGRRRHYMVAAGVGESAVTVNDPARGKLFAIPRADFEKRWAAAHHWLLVAVPAS